MGTTGNLTGLLPTVVMAGVATKMTQSLLSKPAKTAKSKRLTSCRYPSKHRPF